MNESRTDIKILKKGNAVGYDYLPAGGNMKTAR